MKLLKNYIDGLAKTFDWSTRTTRKEYWLFILVNIILGISLALIAFELLNVFNWLMSLTSLSLVASRLNDAVKSKWWMLLFFVHIIGLFGIFYFLVQPSEPKAAEEVTQMPVYV